MTNSIINNLIKLSDKLDRNGMSKDSDTIDKAISKISSIEVSPEEAMSHETHTKSLEMPGAADAEAEEEYERGLMIEEIIDVLVKGSGYMHKDEEDLKRELEDLLEGDHSHFQTIMAIFNKMYPPVADAR